MARMYFRNENHPMRINESKTLAFISHKADIILHNGPLDELAGNGEECFRRLVDIFSLEGPRDKRNTNWRCVLDTVLRRLPDQATFSQNGANYTIKMANTEWSTTRISQWGPVGFILTISPRGWTYRVPGLFLGTNVGSLLAIDRFLPELVRQADILSMLAQIRLAEEEATH